MAPGESAHESMSFLDLQIDSTLLEFNCLVGSASGKKAFLRSGASSKMVFGLPFLSFL